MRLRNRADVKTLIWAFVLFPAVPALGVNHPEFAPWLLLPGLYLGYCAGVLSHNQNHCPTFGGRAANGAYAAWLSIFYGYPTFAWVPTHNQNHHKHRNGAGDATATDRHSPRDTLWNALSYPLRSAFWQADGIARYVADAREHHPRRFAAIVTQYVVVLAAHMGVLAFSVEAHGARTGAMAYALTMGIPSLFALWALMFTNYVQHVGCDPESPDDHSRNFTSRFQNWLLFDAGFHTVHHEKPGAHWSELGALHAERAERIDPRLNQHSILGYCLKRYVRDAFKLSPGARAGGV